MKKILLVEDNELNRDMLTRRLEKRGYKVAVAINGQEGLSFARRGQPNVIILDMNLPDIDGWEVSRRLKADVITLNIPVIALTAHAMTEDRVKALRAGCDEFATKPVELLALISMIESLLAAERL